MLLNFNLRLLINHNDLFVLDLLKIDIIFSNPVIAIAPLGVSQLTLPETPEK